MRLLYRFITAIVLIAIFLRTGVLWYANIGKSGAFLLSERLAVNIIDAVASIIEVGLAIVFIAFAIEFVIKGNISFPILKTTDESAIVVMLIMIMAFIHHSSIWQV